MGGLGRTRNGSYAEFTVAPVGNVVLLGDEVEISWQDMAALPETYAVAWTCLFRNLEVKPGQKVLVRGATSALGLAAVKLAVAAGAKVVGTTRNPERFKTLKELGVVETVKEQDGLAEKLVKDGKKDIDAILNLVGNRVLVDSINIPRRGGRVCHAGWLGGLEPVKDFDPLSQLASGVHFSFFGSFVFGTQEFPLSDVPLAEIVRDVAAGKFDAKPVRVFKFEDIREAQRVLESGEVVGKIVVVH
jgi:NADPH:quinone reductase-like Zn-dependent oxidoreductase